MPFGNDREYSPSLRIAAIGGGTGLSTLLRGVKRLPSKPSITAIVTTFDDGGSSGLLRREFGYPGLGDLRQCLIALASDDNDKLTNVMEFRFPENSTLSGHSIGNLLLAGLLAKSRDISAAVEEAAKMLRIEGRVLPVSLETGELCAELQDGRVISSESAINLRRSAQPRIKRVALRQNVRANPQAIEAVEKADAIVFGPGDLFTSLLPNILVDGMTQAIRESSAKFIFVCNLTTKLGETDGFTASQFVRTVSEYLCCREDGVTDHRHIDAVVVNRFTQQQVREVAENDYYERVVESDIEGLSGVTGQVVLEDMLGSTNPARHHPDKLAAAVVKAIE